MIEAGGGDHRGGHRPARQRLPRALDVTALEERFQLARQRIGVVPAREERSRVPP